MSEIKTNEAETTGRTEEEKETLLKTLKRKRNPVLISGGVGYAYLGVVRGIHQILLPQIILDYGLAPAQSGFFTAIYNYCYAIVSLPAGVITEVLKSRKVMIGSYIAMTLGLVLFAFSPSFPMLVASRAFLGLGGAAFFPGFTKMMASWASQKKFPVYTGYTFSASALGMFLATTPLQLLILGVGRSGALLVLAGFSLLVTGVLFFVARNEPADLGLPTEDELMGNPVPKSVAKNPLAGLWAVAKQPRIWAIIFSSFVANFMGAATGSTAVWMRLSLGYDAVTVANVLMVGTLVGIIAPMIQGVISSRVSIRMSQFIHTGLCLGTFFIFCLFLPKMTPMLVVLINIPSRIGAGMVQPTCQSLMRVNATNKYYATTAGFFNFLGWLVGNGLSAQLFSLFIDENYSIASYQTAYWACFAASAVMGVLAIALTRDTPIPAFLEDAPAKSKA